jgi:hypothetical protein
VHSRAAVVEEISSSGVDDDGEDRRRLRKFCDEKRNTTDMLLFIGLKLS